MPTYSDHVNLLVWRDADGAEHPIKSAEDWKQRREHILAATQLVMGPLPDDSRRVPVNMQVIAEERLERFIRRKITFAVEKNDRLPAYLLIPNDLKQKSPAVLRLHQTTAIGKAEPAGLGGKESLHYAADLAERGFITLAPDYSYFGENKEDPYAMGYQSATMKGIWNHMRCVDLLQSLPQVDPDRIGCIGHSLGGHNTLFLAAFDHRIKASVTNCGFTSFPKYYNGNLTGWTSDKYMPRIASVYNKDPKQVPFDFPEVLAAIAPRAVLVIAPVHDDNFEVSGVKDCVSAASRVFNLLSARNNLIARYPNCAHDFPEGERDAAYDWLAHWLRDEESRR